MEQCICGHFYAIKVSHVNVLQMNYVPEKPMAKCSMILTKYG